MNNRVMDAESQVTGSQNADAHNLDSEAQLRVLGEDDGKGERDVSRGNVDRC